MNELWGSVRYNGRDFEMPDSVLHKINALLRRTAQSNRAEDHLMMGQALVEPIRKVAEYKRWTNIFFMQQTVEPGQDNAVPLDDYTAIAFVSSPTGQVFYTRPGRQYTRPDFSLYDAGIEIGWDDMAEAGWNLLARKQVEAAEEIARKIDTDAQSVIDAAVVAASKTSTVATSMTKSAVDTIIRAMADIGFPPTIAAVNPGTFMDMSDWVFPASNGVWLAPDSVTEELWTQGFSARYGGINWYVHHSVPKARVYFSAGPEYFGWEQTKGQSPYRTGSDVNITKRVDLFTYDTKKAFVAGNNYSMYRLSIT